MELHQRSELRRDMTGADVALLHFELRLLGLRIPEAELAANLFGNDTHAAVAQFQNQSRLPITGVVERETAKRINSTVAERVSAAQILDLLWTEINRYHDQIKQLQTDNPRLQAEIQRLNQILDGLQREYERIKTEAASTGERNAELARLLAAAQTRIRELEDSQNGRPDPTFVVHGHVRQADGRPQVNGSVHAVDRGLRNEQALGNARLDSAGHFQIPYTAEQFTRQGKARADLLIRVLDSSGNLLVSSPIIYSAPADVTIDLIISDDEPRTLSEYERLMAKVTPLLQGLALADLIEDQRSSGWSVTTKS